MAQRKRSEEWTPPLSRLPQLSDAAKRIRSIPAEKLLALLKPQRAGDLAEVAKWLGTDPDILLLFHEGREGTDGLFPALRAYLERRIAATIRQEFKFDNDTDARRFAIRSRLLWAYYAEPPEEETSWFPDHWARGFLLPRYQDYLDAVAYSMWRQAKGRADQFRQIKKRLQHSLNAKGIKNLARLAADSKVDDFVDAYATWRRQTRPGDRQKRGIGQSAIYKARKRGEAVWSRGGWLPSTVVTRRDVETVRPTSLDNIHELTDTKYIEEWELRDPKDSARLRKMFWIELHELSSKQLTHEDRVFIKAARETVAAPIYVSGRVFGAVSPTLRLGPYFARSTAHRHARILRDRGMALGSVRQSAISLTFVRPAAPEQWDA